MVGYTVNTHGRYKCEYCNHKTYKTVSGIERHLYDQHLMSWRLAQKDAEIARLKNMPPKERIVYRDPPEPKDDARYSAVVYCPNCLTVDSVSIVRGQAIGVGGCFRCGAKGGQLVEHVNVQFGDYQIKGSK